MKGISQKVKRTTYLTTSDALIEAIMKPVKKGQNFKIDFMESECFIQDFVLFPRSDTQEFLKELYEYYLKLIEKGKYIFHVLDYSVELGNNKIECFCVVYGMGHEDKKVYLAFKENNTLINKSVNFEDYVNEIINGYEVDSSDFFRFNTLQKVR